MRHPILIVLITLIITACGGKTPPCSDEAVLATVTSLATQSIRDALHRSDSTVNVDNIMSRISVSVANIAETGYEKSIDKHIGSLSK